MKKNIMTIFATAAIVATQFGTVACMLASQQRASGSERSWGAGSGNVRKKAEWLLQDSKLSPPSASSSVKRQNELVLLQSNADGSIKDRAKRFGAQPSASDSSRVRTGGIRGSAQSQSSSNTSGSSSGSHFKDMVDLFSGPQPSVSDSSGVITGGNARGYAQPSGALAGRIKMFSGSPSSASGSSSGSSEQFQSPKNAVQNVSRNPRGIEVGGGIQQLQNLARQNDTLQLRHDMLQSKYDELRSMHGSLARERENLIQRLGEADHQLNEHKKVLQSVMEQHNTLRSEHEAQQESYEQQTQGLRSTFAYHLDEISNTARQINDLAPNKGNLWRKVRELINNIAALKKSIGIDDVDDATSAQRHFDVDEVD
ncbi:MAG: hypothetical protein LBG04_00955 [Holosporaceae bacterium]|nr:hypothetical protein [Holosporaceae bacterium]